MPQMRKALARLARPLIDASDVLGTDDSHRQKIVSAAQDALEAIAEARFATTRGRAIECWQEVLGPSFMG